MKFSAVLFTTLLVAFSGADQNLRGGERSLQEESVLLKDVSITTSVSFTAEVELTLELKNSGPARRNLAVEPCEEGSDDCDENDVLEYNSDASEVTKDVKGKAFGTEALTALSKAVQNKITQDENLMMGITAENATATYQEILDWDDVAGESSGRKLQNYNNAYLRAHTKYRGVCRFCGTFDSDSRRSLEVEGNRKLLQDEPRRLKDACQTLAKKILIAAGRKYDLLSNIDRIGLKMMAPGIDTSGPITCWYPSPPGEDVP